MSAEDIAIWQDRRCGINNYAAQPVPALRASGIMDLASHALTDVATNYRSLLENIFRRLKRFSGKGFLLSSCLPRSIFSVYSIFTLANEIRAGRFTRCSWHVHCQEGSEFLKAEECKGVRWNERGFEEPHGEFQNLRRILS